MGAEHRPEPLDAQRILAELTRHEVDYVLVGGLAAQTHGNTRMTNDIDLIPAPDPRNLDRLADALRALDAQAKPGTRLELVTPSLPWKCSTN